MARTKKAAESLPTEESGKLDEALLQPDADSNKMPRIRMSEIGTNGLRVINKTILEESDKAWRMPQRLRTIDEMCKDEYVAAALQFYITMLARVPYKIKAPKNATAQQKERAKFVESCFNDMDESFFSFLRSALSCIKYGFSVHEVEYKYRRSDNSKYDDGLVGIAGLPSRSQSTISGWIFSQDGRKLDGVEQTLKNIQYGERYSNLAVLNGEKIELPTFVQGALKTMVFSTSPENGNPEGSPILKNAYKAWRYKKEVEASELLGVNRDLSGLVRMKAPAQYFSENASAGEKAIFNSMTKQLRNIARGEQEGVLLPSNYDETTKAPLFDIDLLASSGSKGYDTSQIISRWNTAIMVALGADILNVGNGGTGSFALVEGKQGLVELNLSYRLQEISDLINTQLIPSLFKMNQWTDKDYPVLEFGALSKTSLDELGKFLQRTSAVNAIERDRVVLNKSREAIGAEPFDDDLPPQEQYFTGGTSKSGSGMVEGMPNGQGQSNGSAGDSSSSNSENT